MSVVDPKAPDLFQRLIAFMREADEWGTPADMLRSAEDAGLAIVTEADRKVLEACAAMTIAMPSVAPRPPAKMGPIPKAGVMAVVEAELEARKTRAK